MPRRQREVDLPAYLDWKEIGPPDPPTNERRLKLMAGFIYRMRLFHRPIRFRRLMKLDLTTRIVPYTTTEHADGAVIVRYAINVLDRADGRLKVLEEGEPLFIQFRRAYENTGIDLGGRDGFDVAIEVAGEGLSRKYRVSYDSNRPTPFSDADKALLREQMIHLPSVFTPSNEPSSNAIRKRAKSG